MVVSRFIGSTPGRAARAGKALGRVGVSLLVSQLQHCLEDDEYAREQGYDPGKVERLFLSLT